MTEGVAATPCGFRQEEELAAEPVVFSECDLFRDGLGLASTDLPGNAVDSVACIRRAAQ